jgi:hypothetical protein
VRSPDPGFPPHRALSLRADYEQSVVTDEDVALLHEHDHIVSSPAAGLFASRNRTRSHPGAN